MTARQHDAHVTARKFHYTTFPRSAFLPGACEPATRMSRDLGVDHDAHVAAFAAAIHAVTLDDILVEMASVIRAAVDADDRRFLLDFTRFHHVSWMAWSAIASDPIASAIVWC